MSEKYINKEKQIKVKMPKEVLQGIAIAVGVFLTGLGGAATMACLQQSQPLWVDCVPVAGLAIVGVILIIVGFYA